MVLPIDNSTDPPFRDLTVMEVEANFGALSTMTPSSAHDALSSLCAPHWVRVEQSDLVLRELAKKAGILQDLDALTDFGIETFYVPSGRP